MGRNERGITILGFLFVSAVVIIFALVGFRVMPAYIEYFAVQKALQQALDDSPDGNVAEVRRAFDRKTSAGYIESVRPNDVLVKRQSNQVTAEVSWQRVLPMIGNASILLDFDAAASR
jgi:ABC-type branched-subunit amino acid transport system substrate-binding protein